jgi:putative peptidoglycan lipid II flippase
VLLSIPFYLLGLKFMGTRGVALAVSLSAILQAVVLYALWNKRSHNAGSKEVYWFYLKIMALSTLVGIGLAWFKRQALFWLDSTRLGPSLITVLLTGALCMALLLVAGYGLKINEFKELMLRFTNKLKDFKF